MLGPVVAGSVDRIAGMSGSEFEELLSTGMGRVAWIRFAIAICVVLVVVIVKAVAAVVRGGGGGVKSREGELLERSGDPSKEARSGGLDGEIEMWEGGGESEMSDSDDKLRSSTEKVAKRSLVRSSSSPWSDWENL
jgi:hypothetical protein